MSPNRERLTAGRLWAFNAKHVGNRMSDEPRRERPERQPDPTPEEIAERAAEVRSRWTEADYERKLRWMDQARVEWAIPEIATDQLGD